MNGNKASFQTEGTFVPDGLQAGDFPVRTEKRTILSGQNLARGALIGLISLGALSAVGAAGVPAPAAATITASPTVAAGTKVGVHHFQCVEPGATTVSKWNHYDPDGLYVGTASGNTAYSGGGLSALTITDAGTDPVVGETFTVTVTAAAGSGKAILSLAAATDGSQTPVEILAEAADASSGDVQAITYKSGDFNQDAITFGTGHTAASVKAGLQDRNIYLHAPTSV